MNLLSLLRGMVFLATLGGMMGNNSAGSHSIVYGKTIDHVHEVRCLLADGTETVFGEIDAAGLQAKQKLDGISIFPLLKNPGNDGRKEPLFWHYPLAKPHFLGGHSGGAIRQGPWKLIEWFDTGKIELFNIQEDTAEAKDLFARRRETADELLKRLRSWRKELGAKTTVGK